jgi:hypothetical protein
MTNQKFDIFIYENFKYNFNIEPLNKFLEDNQINICCFNDPNCIKGYIATWEIKNDKMFLTNIEIVSDVKNNLPEILFKNENEVFANWYSGEIQILNIDNEITTLQFKNGNLISKTIKENIIEETQQMKELSLKDEINNSNLYELIEMFNSELKIVAKENYSKFRNNKADSSLKDYVKIDISDWNALEKEKLFVGALKGINIFYYSITSKTKMPVSGFNSVMDAINGENFVFVNIKSIKWFPTEIKNKIKSQNIEFEELNTKYEAREFQENHFYEDRYDENNWLAEAAGTDDPETMNDVYWNLD